MKAIRIRTSLKSNVISRPQVFEKMSWKSKKLSFYFQTKMIFENCKNFVRKTVAKIFGNVEPAAHNVVMLQTTLIAVPESPLNKGSFQYQTAE